MMKLTAGGWPFSVSGLRCETKKRIGSRRRRRRSRRISALALAVIALMTALCASALTVSAGDDEVYNWYCVRRKNHERPAAESGFGFIEQVGGWYIDRRPACCDPASPDKVVYLTFDAGYENGNVARVLDALRDEGVPGAFFILGNPAVRNPELVRRMRDEGHLVCNHSYSHKDMTGWTAGQVADELKKLETAAADCAGVTVSPYFRPPEGRFSRQLLEAVQAAGYKTIFWSLAYADWDNDKQPDPVRAKQLLLDNVHPGAVILLHPTSATNAAILGDVIRALKAQGYRFGTLDELTGRVSDAEGGA